jgi:sporulation protein YabP
MMITEDNRNGKRGDKLHNLMMEGREKLTISGVEHMGECNEDKVVFYTTMGVLEIHGTDMNINKLNLENGEVQVDGMVYDMSYTDEDTKHMSFLQKLFR